MTSSPVGLQLNLVMVCVVLFVVYFDSPTINIGLHAICFIYVKWELTMKKAANTLKTE